MGGAGKSRAEAATAVPEVPLAELAAAFEHAPVGMAITDQGAVLLHANHALADMLGYAAEELTGKSVVDLTHPEDLADSQDKNRRLAAGEVKHFSLVKRYLHRSGRVVWARVHVSLLTDGARRHHLLHVVDITNEKASLDELGRAEQRFREMADSIEQDFWVLRLDPSELLYVSPAAARIWGFDPMVNRNKPGRIRKLVHPEDQSIFGELFDLSYADAREREYRVIKQDGSEKWFRTRVFPTAAKDGRIDRAAGVTEDITPRKLAELEIERRRAFDRLLMKLSTGFVNLPQDRTREGFENALRELGELIGAEAGAIFLLDERREFLTMRYSWSTAEEPLTHLAFTEFAFGAGHPMREAVEQDGLLRIPDIASLPDEAKDVRERLQANGFKSFIDVPLWRRGELIGLYGFGTFNRVVAWSDEAAERLKIAAELFGNALDRERAETEARTHREALAHALRVGTMGQLASGIAHELNQPLAAILNYASGIDRRLAAGDVTDEHVQDTVRRIVEQAIRAADVMKTLRALVRKGEGDFTWQDPNQLVRATLTFVEPEAASVGVELVADLDPRVPQVVVDAIQIEQVVLNLLRNALDAVQTSNDERRGEIRISTGTDLNGDVEITVADNGPGVDAERSSRVFEEFYTTKPAGLGLGLSISRSIVEAHGGRLELVANGDDGATFRVTLLAAP